MKEQVFYYSKTQRIKRYDDGSKKRFCVQHKNKSTGEWVNGAGSDLFLLYRQDKVVGERKVFVLEGEKCADIAAEGGLAAVSQPGHASGDDKQRLERYRQLAAAGTHEIVIVVDNDSKGLERANACAASASEAGLEVRVLQAEQVCLASGPVGH